MNLNCYQMELNDLEPGHVMFQVQAEIKRGHDEVKLKPAPHSRSYSILNTIIKCLNFSCRFCHYLECMH